MLQFLKKQKLNTKLIPEKVRLEAVAWKCSVKKVFLEDSGTGVFL